MSAMDDAGSKVIAHFNRRGDIEGQRLFYLYTVEVEKQLKEKGLLTISRNLLPDHGKSKLDAPRRNENIQRVVDYHHVSESNARHAAKRVLTILRRMEPTMRRETLQSGVIEDWGKGYKIHADHIPLFCKMVQEGAKGLG